MLFQININEIACVIETTVFTRTRDMSTLADRFKLPVTTKIPDDEVVRRVEVTFKSGRQIVLNGDQVEILERKFKECGEL